MNGKAALRGLRGQPVARGEVMISVEVDADGEAEDQARGSGSSVVERFKKCRASGDRAGMAFWRSVSVYSVVSAMHGPEKIRIVDG